MAHSLFAAAFPPGQDSIPMEPSASASSSASSHMSSLQSSTASSSSFSSSTQLPTSQRALLSRPSVSSSSSITTPANKTTSDSAFAMTPGFKKPLDISNLMSPPEPDQLDSFSISNDDDRSHNGSPSRRCSVISGADVNMLDHSSIEAHSQGLVKDGVPNNGPLSPPISPKDKKAASESVDQAARDPILYPAASDSCLLPRSRPLFAPDDDPATGTSDVVHEHVAARSPALFCRASPPRGEEYELALYLKSEVMKQYMMDRRGWLRQERDQLVADRRAAANRNKHLQRAVSSPRPTTTTQRLLTPRMPRAQHFSHAATTPEASPLQQTQTQQQQQQQHQQQQRSSPLHPLQDSSSRVTKRTSRANLPARTSLPARIAPQVSGTPRRTSGSNTSSMRVPGSSPEPRVRTAAPNREDKDFLSLPDYCPPLTTLPERTNNLKVDWKGNALDLSRDPHLHLLHRDEIGLAASLRLDCATYLTSKRRIFMRRLECARIGKEFRKTDAQQACKIDVNKASKLWTAYEKVGWLRIDHMRRFM